MPGWPRITLWRMMVAVALAAVVLAVVQGFLEPSGPIGASIVGACVVILAASIARETIRRESSEGVVSDIEGKIAVGIMSATIALSLVFLSDLAFLAGYFLTGFFLTFQQNHVYYERSIHPVGLLVGGVTAWIAVRKLTPWFLNGPYRPGSAWVDPTPDRMAGEGPVAYAVAVGASGDGEVPRSGRKMHTYIVTVSAADRVGIVHSVTGTLRDLRGNILELSQTVMRDYFTIILAVEFDEPRVPETLASAITERGGAFGMTVAVMPAAPGGTIPPVPNGERFILTVLGEDHAGNIHGISGCLTRLGVNIVDLHARAENGRFSLVMEAFLPHDLAPSVVPRRAREVRQGPGPGSLRPAREHLQRHQRAHPPPRRTPGQPGRGGGGAALREVSGRPDGEPKATPLPPLSP